MASSIIILKPVYDYSPGETIKAFERAVTAAGWGFNKFDPIQGSEGTIILVQKEVSFFTTANKSGGSLFLRFIMLTRILRKALSGWNWEKSYFGRLI